MGVVHQSQGHRWFQPVTTGKSTYSREGTRVASERRTFHCSCRTPEDRQDDRRTSRGDWRWFRMSGSPGAKRARTARTRKVPLAMIASPESGSRTVDRTEDEKS